MTDTTDFTSTSQPTESQKADAPDATEASTGQAKRKQVGLSSLVLPELQRVAQQLGITGIARMRKGQLIEAIEAAQGGTSATKTTSASEEPRRRTRRTRAVADKTDDEQGQLSLGETSGATAGTDKAGKARPEDNGRPADAEKADETGKPTRGRAAARTNPVQTDPAQGDSTQGTSTQGDSTQKDSDQKDSGQGDSDPKDTVSGDTRSDNQNDNQGEGGQSDGGQREGGQRRRGDRNRNRDRGNDSRGGDNRGGDNRDSGRDNRDSGRDSRDRDNRDRDNRDRDNRGDDDDDGRGRRRRRSRDRFRERGSSSNRRDRYDPEPQLSDDDVLIPVAGIVDVLDNYAFVRTSGYLPGPNDVYVSMALVKRYGLRKGDAISGAIRQPKDGERREKFNPLVRVDTVNGGDPESGKQRTEFNKLTPLYPQERLRLETDSTLITTRLIDLIAPIGKGQRGLIVSPAKAGKTLILQSIANAITENNPEAHLMVVLVDERPEEVTDMQRAVKGEVIASTFDRPADDHTTVAELSIERAKRLVELGHDVVVLLDSITRLGRAYNIAAPASGRILSGGVDSSALYPPKRFFGAARNVENGGSLTILATALVETGSKADEVIFEEFKGTGNMELRLKRDYAEKRIFPAIDVDPSSTRREELLMNREELQIVWKLRRVLSGLDGLQALELLIDRLKKTKSNAEFLMTINKTMPAVGSGSSRDDD